MPVKNKKSLLVLSYYLCIALKHLFQPAQSNVVVRPPRRRGGEEDLVSHIDALDPISVYVFTRSFVYNN